MEPRYLRFKVKGIRLEILDASSCNCNCLNWYGFNLTHWFLARGHNANIVPI